MTPLILEDTPTRQIVLEKNGAQFVELTWAIDPTRPRIWLEGHQYRFSRQLVSQRYLRPADLPPSVLRALTSPPATKVTVDDPATCAIEAATV